MNELFIYLGIYVLVLIIMSFYFSRGKGNEYFLISGRDRAGWQILLSKFASAIGVGWFITYTAYAYEFGNSIFMILLGFIIGYFLFAYWAAPVIYEHSKKNKFYTIGDFVFFHTKSRFSKLLVHLVYIFIQLLWSLIGFVGGAKLMSHLGLMSYGSALIFTSIVVLIYLLLAGYFAVIITDVFQSIIILILLFVVAFSIIGSTSISTVLSTNSGTLGIGGIIGFLLYGSFSVFSFADRYQLCYAAKDLKSLKRGLASAIYLILISAFFLLLIGLFMYSQNPALDPDIVFLEALKFYLPESLLAISFVMFFAGLMSSADTGIYGTSSHIAFSFFDKEKSKLSVKHIRYITLFTVILLTTIAYYFKDIVEISILAGAFSLVLSIPMMYLIAGYRNNLKFLGSIFGGILGAISGIIIIGLDPSAAVFVFAGGLVGLLYNKRIHSVFS